MTWPAVALRYLSAFPRWRFFPTDVQRRAPLIKTGKGHLEGATDDPDVIAEWVARWPSMALSLPTGAVTGVVVIDADVKNGGRGIENLRALESTLGELPTSHVVRTQSGGLHVYAAHPGEGVRVKCSAGKIVRGVDIRGDGGQALLPPSKGYRWISGPESASPLRPLPPAWLARLTSEAVADRSADRSYVLSAPPYVLAAAREYLGRIGPAVRGQGADDHTYRVAAHLVGSFALSADDALELLGEWNDRNPEPWPWSKLQGFVGHASNYATGGGEERGALTVHALLADAGMFRSAAPLTRIEVEEHLKAAAAKLAGRRSDGRARATAKLLRSVLDGTLPGDDDTERARNLALAASALVSEAPAAIEPDTLVAVLAQVTAHPDDARAALDAARSAQNGVVTSQTAVSEFDEYQGRPRANSQQNALLALEKLGVSLAFDELRETTLVQGLRAHGLAGDDVQRLSDATMNRLIFAIDQHFGFQPAPDWFWRFLEDQSRLRSFHPVREYLDSLSWDGRPRIETWLVDYGGAKDTPYVRAVSRLILLAAVRRIRHPGAKFDEMLVLEGPQGANKSSAVRALAVRDAWFTDEVPLGASSREILEALEGVWIAEAQEMVGLRKSDDAAMKSFLRKSQDRARLAYGRGITERRRQCVIIGTTNKSQYLRDPTGNRSYWPVYTPRFDAERLRGVVEQLWAEASEAEAGGASIRLDPALYSEAADEQEARREVSPIEAQLADLLSGIDHGVIRAADIYRALGLDTSTAQRHYGQIAEALERLGWSPTTTRWGGRAVSGDKKTRCYIRGAAGAPPFEASMLAGSVTFVPFHG